MTNTAHLTELGHSPDALAQRQADLLALLRQTAPEVLSDNQINIEKLKELLGQERIAPAEHYELNWAGKTEARREIQKTSSHTLRPDANNPASAQHMLIEGENLEVLRVLQKSYYGKVKMIYIDPPYNTGNDSFVYPDDYSETLDEYQKRTGEKSADGYLNKQSLWKKNSKESGQYHSAWLSMMYPRLYLARNLLTEDGVIFLSINDIECGNLISLCNEIFGEENKIACLVWDKNHSAQAGVFKVYHEYVLVYAKNSHLISTPTALDDAAFEAGAMKKVSQRHPASEFTFPKGVRIEAPEGFVFGTSWGGVEAVEVVSGTLRVENGLTAEAVTLRAGFTQRNQMNQYFYGDRENLLDSRGQKILEFYFSSSGKIKIIKERGVETPDTTLAYGTQSQASNELAEILGAVELFDNPKPPAMIGDFIKWFTDDGDLILDFFAGSGATAHAVLNLFTEKVERQFICVQIPEETFTRDAVTKLEKPRDGSAGNAYRAGYKTIADITRARIDKVIAKLKTEHPDKTADLACAHFTLAPSNFKVWRGDVGSADALREQLALFQSAEKAGQPQATDAQTAMLAELLLKHGLGALGVHAVSAPKQVASVTVHRVLLPDDRHMWLCFEHYTDALKDEMVKARPAQVVLLNSCFVGDKADEQLANLQLELAGLDIGLTVI